MLYTVAREVGREALPSLLRTYDNRIYVLMTAYWIVFILLLMLAQW